MAKPAQAAPANSPLNALNSMVKRGDNPDADPKGFQNLSETEVKIVSALEEGGPYAYLKAYQIAGGDNAIDGALAPQRINEAIRKASYETLQKGGIVTQDRYRIKLFGGDEASQS
jgi:hypothetical protein